MYGLLYNWHYSGPEVDETSGQQMPKMDARVAESIVRKWQDIKAQAFGPDHQLKKLEEVKI